MRGGYECDAVDPVRESHDSVKPSGDAHDTRRRQVSRDGSDERLASRPVTAARLTQMPVVAAALDEARERELVQRRRSAAREHAALGCWLHEPPREHEPTESQRRRERLARGAQVDDVVGREALQRRERRAVVAELGVVIVVDHNSSALAGPLEQRRPPRRGERDPGGELMRGGDDDPVERARARLQRAQPVNLGAVVRRPRGS